MSDLAERIESSRSAAIGIRELHLDTSRVVKEVADGTRLVVTNHGSPRAVIFSMRDAVELALEPRFVALEELALQELDEDLAVAPWAEGTGPYEILFSAQAAADLEALSPKRLHGILRRFLVRAARRPRTRNPIWVEETTTGRLLISFSRHGAGLLLVHAIIDACEVEDVLIGSGVASDRTRRNRVRLAHTRDLNPRRLSRSPARRARG